MLLDAKQLDPKFERWYKEFMATKFPTVKSVEINIPASDLKYEKKDTGVRVEVPMNSTMESIVLPATAHVKFVNAPEKDVSIYWNSIGRFDGRNMEEQNFSLTLEYGNYVPDNVSIPMMTIQAKDMRLPKNYYRYMMNKFPSNKTTVSYQAIETIPADVISELKKDSETTYVSDAHEMFYGCGKLKSLPSVGLDFTKATDVHDMFYGCRGIKTIPPEYLNLPSVTNAKNFMQDVILDEIDFNQLKLDSLEKADSLLYNAEWKKHTGKLMLKNVKSAYRIGGGFGSDSYPVIELPKATSISGIFTDQPLSCSVFDGIIAPNATNCSGMFANNYGITELKVLEVPNNKNLYHAFYNCFKLVSLPVIDLTNVTDVTDMLFKCKALTEVRFKNVPQSLADKLTRENLDTSGTTTFDIIIE